MTEPITVPYSPPAPTVQTRYNVRVTRTDGVVVFDGSITDQDRFSMEQAAGKSTTVSLTATAVIEGLLANPISG